ncbi:hypothetical protein QMO17_34590, partial [Klebsiella pneumoniae]|nr:hypothetical protein [Klebsiella pneumoniae]
SCCAPVLAGVIALSSVAPSAVLAAGLGGAYVFGMLAPLFVISLLWERYDWRSSRLFRSRSLTWRIGPLQRTLSASMLASGLLLAVIGIATLWTGLAYHSMPTSSHWALVVSVWLQHIGQLVTNALSVIPNWLAAVLLLVAVTALVLRARTQWRPARHDDKDVDLQKTRQE